MTALDLSLTGEFSPTDFDDLPEKVRASENISLNQECFDSLRSGETNLERFAPAWGELLQCAVEDPGLICEAYTRFHGYSLGNRFAALVQCEMRGLEVGPLNSFGGWLKLGYAVKEGEKALTLCMPLKGTLHREKKSGNGHAKAPDAAPDVEEVSFIRAFVWKPNWFVLSQTVPLSDDPLVPPQAAPLLWDRDKALQTLKIEQKPFDSLDGNVLGWARGQSLAVSPLSPLPFKTLFHEMAHIVLGHTTHNFRGDGNTALDLSDSETLPLSLIEVEAECVALLCLATLDLPGQEFCRGYIQHWAQGQDIPEKSAQRIFGAADRILAAGAGEERRRDPTAEELGLTGQNGHTNGSGSATAEQPLPATAQGLPPPVTAPQAETTVQAEAQALV